jgi:hypothetical protein
MIPLDGKMGETTVMKRRLPENPSQKTSVLVLFYLQEHSTKWEMETTTLSRYHFAKIIRPFEAAASK